MVRPSRLTWLRLVISHQCIRFTYQEYARIGSSEYQIQSLNIPSLQYQMDMLSEYQVLYQPTDIKFRALAPWPAQVAVHHPRGGTVAEQAAFEGQALGSDRGPHDQAEPAEPFFEGGKTLGKWPEMPEMLWFIQDYHLVMTKIAMENPSKKWRY
jgi:hypothetical protein